MILYTEFCDGCYHAWTDSQWIIFHPVYILMPARDNTGLKLVYAEDDLSVRAQRWRGDPDVKLALTQWKSVLAGNVYRWPERRVTLTPGNSSHSVSMSELAAAFELGLGPTSIPRQLDAGIGVKVFGVGTQQSVVDIAIMHELLWRTRPRVLVELGTMCGGSTIFFANTMRAYGSQAVVITFDVSNQSGKYCRPDRPGVGLFSPQWRHLSHAGAIIAVVDDVLSAASAALLASITQRPNVTVAVVDDGDHAAGAVIRHFVGLGPLVSPGHYYIIEDTRLDSTCAYAMLTVRAQQHRDSYCRQILRGGGPAVAIANITNSDAFRTGHWVQDRSVEQWGITQHPGGYLRARPREGFVTDDDGVIYANQSELRWRRGRGHVYSPQELRRRRSRTRLR